LNVGEVPAIFDLLEREGIERACFYHLVYTGRGSKLIETALGVEETRSTVDTIISRTEDIFQKKRKMETLTVDNHSDGPYLYLKVREKDPRRAEKILGLLRKNGGNRSGIGIAGINSIGEVFPDQFWQTQGLGNIRERRFSDIWTDSENSLLQRLRERPRRLSGRCGKCRFLEICNGNFRARAEAVYDDPWASDPACYLTDEEIRWK
jgi:radical SAM protein with 4Fe4S-binding SPASM domain